MGLINPKKEDKIGKGMHSSENIAVTWIDKSALYFFKGENRKNNFKIVKF